MAYYICLLHHLLHYFSENVPEFEDKKVKKYEDKIKVQECIKHLKYYNSKYN